ncbi:MAG: M81 family metallopeptidase, partial [Deltaproteobacteria bacterium]|nr:M81 family metallopeptidase [Deltaproteobacteria bacterium]
MCLWYPLQVFPKGRKTGNDKRFNRRGVMGIMKLFIASLEHETNTFSPLPTNLESYRNMVLFRPSDGGVAGGYDRCVDFVDLAEEKGYDVVRSLVAVAQPAGPTTRYAYESLRDEILDDLRAAGTVDMVFLVLHGAQMAEGYDDCEGDLITRVRAIVGDAVPIGV